MVCWLIKAWAFQKPEEAKDQSSQLPVTMATKMSDFLPKTGGFQFPMLFLYNDISYRLWTLWRDKRLLRANYEQK